jgi:hypothetical protein
MLEAAHKDKYRSASFPATHRHDTLHRAMLAACTPAESRALAPSALKSSDGLLVCTGATFLEQPSDSYRPCIGGTLPAIYPEREYADDGGLIAYGPNVRVHFRHAAVYVDRILRGASPGDLPINASSKFISSSTFELPVSLD